MVQANDNSMQVKLFVSARNLKDKDLIGKSDPQCLLFEKTIDSDWQLLGKTEKVKDNFNPDFSTSFTVSFRFELEQQMRFVIIDGDEGGEYDELGDAVISLGQLLGAGSETWNGILQKKGTSGGEIIVRSEAIRQSIDWLRMDITMNNLNNIDPVCMGLCPERLKYRVEIQRFIQETQSWVTSVTCKPPYSWVTGNYAHRCF